MHFRIARKCEELARAANRSLAPQKVYFVQFGQKAPAALFSAPRFRPSLLAECEQEQSASISEKCFLWLGKKLACGKPLPRHRKPKRKHARSARAFLYAKPIFCITQGT